MKKAAEIEALFSGLGADFVVTAEEIQDRLNSVRAFVFDWDGIFNSGAKGKGVPSTFSEPDSMGTNMLRYAYWRNRGELSVFAVVSSADNPTAKQLARREHFDAAYCGFGDKDRAFDALCEHFAISRAQVAYVFDDINDLAVARQCALRILVRRRASPLLREFCEMKRLVDYVTAAQSDEYAVREISEMLIALLGGYPDVFDSRSAYDAEYQKYFATRQSVTTLDVDAH